MKLSVLPGCVLLLDNYNFKKYLENGCSTMFCHLFLHTWPLTASRCLFLHFSQLLSLKNLHTLSYAVFINSRTITFLFPTTGLPENCVLPTWQGSHELAILLSLCSLPLAARSCRMPYGHLFLLFFSLLPWKLQEEKDQLLTARTNRDFPQERNSDGKRPSGVPWLSLNTFSFQLLIPFLHCAFPFLLVFFFLT